MALPFPSINPNNPIPNNPFYSPETSYLQGPYYPAIIDPTSGLVVNPNGTITVTGGGGGGGVSQIIPSAGISVSPSGGTGVVTIGNTGVLSLTAGAGITLTGNTGNITISSAASGGTVTNVIGVSPISVASGTTIPIISVGAASTTTTGVTSLVNNLTTNDSTKALTAAQGFALQQQIASLTVSGGLTLAGTFSASTSTLATVTSAGAALVPPFVVGGNLPNPAPSNNNYFVIVTTPGTYDPPGPGGPYSASQGDWFLSNGTQWSWLNVGFDAPSATTTVAGIVRLATVSEAQTGTDSTIALTPASASATYVPKSCFPTKGTLIAGTSAPNTPTALPLDSAANGYVLTVDLTCSTGLKWAAPTGGGGGTGTVTFVGTGAALSGGPITTSGSIDLVNRGIAPASYSNPTVTVNCYGIITGITSGGAALPCSLITAKGALITGCATGVACTLPAGSDGFVLTACSACACGLTWVSNSAGSAAIPCAQITGKGAILTGTAANAPTALPLGPDGSFLKANSLCNCGLEWVLPTNSGGVAPSSPAIGTLWYDTAANPDILKAWDGTAWIPVNSTSSPTAPTSPIIGQMWTDTSVTPPVVYAWNGTSWLPLNFSGSTTAPTSPLPGQTWINTSLNPPVEYIWTGTQWVPTSSTASTTAPASPILGQTWVNTSLTPPVQYVWNGTAWTPTSNVASNTAPTTPTLGQIWNDTSGSDPILKTWTGSAWTPIGVTVDPTAPTGPVTGQLWNDTSGVTPVLKTWNGSTWVATGTGTVTSVTAGTGLSGGTITSSGTIALSNTTVTPGNYTGANITVDAQGRITAASNGTVCLGTVTNVATGTGLTGGPITSTGTIALANTAVTAGSYTYGSFTVDAQGRLTAASSGTSPVTSIVTGTGLTGGPITSTGTIALANTAVTPGSYTYGSFTVDAQGRLTAASSGLAPVTAITGTLPIVITGTTTPVISINSATTSSCGAVQLYDGRNSTSTTLALTANQGKLLQDQIDSLTNSGGLTVAGTLDASTGLVANVTTAGLADGFANGSGLPAASATTVNDYVIVTKAGSYDPPGPGGPYNAGQGDWFLVIETSPGVYQWSYLNVGYDPAYAGINQCGVVCLSTDALAIAGTDTLTALTPANAAAAYIPKACVTAKGTLITGTAASTPVALPVGSDGQALVACSACASGLAWATAAVSNATPTVFGIVKGCTDLTNAALGCNALLSNTTGTGNVAIGLTAGCSATIAVNNVFVGNGAGKLTTSSGQVAIGACSLGSATTGCRNTAVGEQAAGALTTGDYTTALGWASLCSSTTGIVNTAIGASAGKNITTGSFNVIIGPSVDAPSAIGSCQLAIGFDANCCWLTGDSNRNIRPAAGLLDCTGSTGSASQVLLSTGTGICWATVPAPTDATPTSAGIVKGCTNNALFNTMLGCNAGVVATGCDSVFVGYNAGCSVTSAIRNTIVGACSGQAITTGCFNTVFGAATGCGITTSIGNVLIGHAAGRCVSADSNTLVGSDAGFNITTGTLNVALGSCALGVPFAAANTGCCNVAIGVNALSAVTTGNINTAVGYNAGCSITIGCNNQLFGSLAGDSITTGSNNVLIGQIAGCSLISASDAAFIGGGAGMCATVGCQTFVGHTAGASVTTGAGNTALGYQALGFVGAVTPNTANFNVAIGECSLRSITSGGNNTAVGYWAGKAATTSCSNALFGSQSGTALTTGSFNALFGHISGANLTTGSRNTAIGGGAGSSLTTGCDNSFLGDLAGSGVTTGSGNVAIGPQSLATTNTGLNNLAIGRCALFNFSGSASGNVGVGDLALLSLTSGANNTALGSCAGDSLTTGFNNVVIGASAGCSMTTAFGSVVIGTSAGCSALGNCSVFLGLDAGSQVTTGSNNVIIGPAVQPASLTGSCQLAIGFAAGCCWLTGDANRNIRPAKGIIDCNGCTGTVGQALSVDNNGNLLWGGNYGDTPVGTIGFFAANSVPCGWLVADGSAVSRTTYATLFSVIGTTYGAGDGSTTFTLPDMRGQFARGWDAAGGTARGCDSGRVFGSSQGFAMQPIVGCVAPIAETFSVWGSPQAPTAGNALWRASGSPIAGCTPATVDSSTAGTLCFCSSLVVATDCETRPMNVALLPCIKWQVTTAPSSCGIPCACLTGRGALVTATGNATPVALPPGPNGTVLVACNTDPSGLVWASPQQSMIAAQIYCTFTQTGRDPIPFWSTTYAIDPTGQFSIGFGDARTNSTMFMPVNKLIKIELSLSVSINSTLDRQIRFYRLGDVGDNQCNAVNIIYLPANTYGTYTAQGVICTSPGSCAFNWKANSDYPLLTACTSSWIATVLN